MSADHQDPTSNVVPLSRAARRREGREASKQPRLNPVEPMEALGNAMRLVDAAKQHGGKPGLYAIAAEDQLGNVEPQGVVLVCQGPMADLMIDQLTQVMIAMGQAEFWPPQAGLTVQLEGILEEKRRAKLGILVTDRMPTGGRPA